MSSASPTALQLVLVTGLSGSGKTVALHALEDLDFYCVDNLPAGLLINFLDNINANRDRYDRVAIGIDARNRDDSLANLPAVLSAANRDSGQVKVMFLTADEKTLLQRFSETRRRHPLTTDQQTLPEAIEQEKAVLSELERRADFVIDTSDINIHQLRGQIWKLVERGADRPVTLVLESFAFKRGVPQDADFLFDARCLPNPHWEPSLRGFSGLEPVVAEWLQASELVQTMIKDIESFLHRWLPHFQAGQRSYVTVGIGCTGGKHRSVFLVEQIRQRLADGDSPIVVKHRELT